MKKTNAIGGGPASKVIDAAADWLSRCDAGLTPNDETQFRAWLAADARHVAAVAQLQATWGALDGPLNRGTTAVILRELERFAGQRTRRHRGAAAVGLTLLLVAGFLWRGPQPRAVAPTPSTAVVLLPNSRILPDGSVVELKNGAQIAVDFNGALRRVALRQGEAHFEVVKNNDRAFVVVANGVEVRAVGTAFSVELGQQSVAVLVTEGRVSVNSEKRKRKAEDGGPSAPQTAGNALTSNLRPLSSDVLVDAGNRLVVELAPRVKMPPAAIHVLADELAERLAWRARRLEFSGTPLSEAVAMLNRHSRVQFVIEDRAIAEEQVSGLFRADKADAFVHVLEAGFRIKAEPRGESVIALRRAP